MAVDIQESNTHIHPPLRTMSTRGECVGRPASDLLSYTRFQTQIQSARGQADGRRQRKMCAIRDSEIQTEHV